MLTRPNDSDDSGRGLIAMTFPPPPLADGDNNKQTGDFSLVFLFFLDFDLALTHCVFLQGCFLLLLLGAPPPHLPLSPPYHLLPPAPLWRLHFLILPLSHPCLPPLFPFLLLNLLLIVPFFLFQQILLSPSFLVTLVNTTAILFPLIPLFVFLRAPLPLPVLLILLPPLHFFPLLFLHPLPPLRLLLSSLLLLFFPTQLLSSHPSHRPAAPAPPSYLVSSQPIVWRFGASCEALWPPSAVVSTLWRGEAGGMWGERGADRLKKKEEHPLHTVGFCMNLWPFKSPTFPLTFCFPLAPATSPLSPSLTDEEEDEDRKRKRRKKQRDISHSFKNREEDEVEKDEGRFVVRMAVSFGGEVEGAPLLLHHLNHSRRADSGSTQPEKVVTVYRPNGFRTPPVLQLRWRDISNKDIRLFFFSSVTVSDVLLPSNSLLLEYVYIFYLIIKHI